MPCIEQVFHARLENIHRFAVFFGYLAGVIRIIKPQPFRAFSLEKSVQIHDDPQGNDPVLQVKAFCGVLLSSKLNTGSSIYGDSTALSVNCGCVVGGTSFAGGVGSVPQTFIGLMVIQMPENCMNMLGINACTRQVCEGLIILAILWSDNYAQKRRVEAV